MQAGTRWIVGIVGVLAITIGSGVTLAVVAHSGDRSRVLPDYYQRAANYDERVAKVAANQKLGWQTTVRSIGGNVQVCVTDASKLPVLTSVAISAFHRTAPKTPLTIAMGAADAQGCAVGALPPQRGWYELEIDAKGQAGAFWATSSVERL